MQSGGEGRTFPASSWARSHRHRGQTSGESVQIIDYSRRYYYYIRPCILLLLLSTRLPCTYIGQIMRCWWWWWYRAKVSGRVLQVGLTRWWTSLWHLGEEYKTFSWWWWSSSSSWRWSWLEGGSRREYDTWTTKLLLSPSRKRMRVDQGEKGDNKMWALLLHITYY